MSDEIIEGEIVEGYSAVPPEPPHDHVIETMTGDFYAWDAQRRGWSGCDSNFGSMSTWESLVRWGEIVVYAPVATFKRQTGTR